MKPNLEDSFIGAKALLGWRLVRYSSEGMTAGIIVETESYHMDDAASHAYGGERIRNSSLFRSAGTIYIYFTYGMHYCFNIVTGEEGSGQGVLIRALEPTEGIDLMKQRRMKPNERDLCNGPAKLVQAMGITKDLNGKSLSDGIISLEPGIKPKHITQTTRVGISKAKDNPWRFYITDSTHVSVR